MMGMGMYMDVMPPLQQSFGSMMYNAQPHPMMAAAAANNPYWLQQRYNALQQSQ